VKAIEIEDDKRILSHLPTSKLPYLNHRRGLFPKPHCCSRIWPILQQQ